MRNARVDGPVWALRSRVRTGMGSDASSPAVGWVAVVVDARDPDTLAAFWARVLGGGEVEEWSDARGTRFVQLDRGAAPCLLFQTAPEPAGNGAVHLDVAPPAGGSQAAEVRRLREEGATLLSDDPDLPWVVLADPEGNRFCVLEARS